MKRQKIMKRIVSISLSVALSLVPITSAMATEAVPVTAAVTKQVGPLSMTLIGTTTNGTPIYFYTDQKCETWYV